MILGYIIGSSLAVAWHVCACKALLISEVACSLDRYHHGDFSFHVSVFSDQLVLDVDHSRRYETCFMSNTSSITPFNGLMA